MSFEAFILEKNQQSFFPQDMRLSVITQNILSIENNPETGLRQLDQNQCLPSLKMSAEKYEKLLNSDSLDQQQLQRSDGKLQMSKQLSQIVEEDPFQKSLKRYSTKQKKIVKGEKENDKENKSTNIFTQNSNKIENYQQPQEIKLFNAKENISNFQKKTQVQTENEIKDKQNQQEFSQKQLIQNQKVKLLNIISQSPIKNKSVQEQQEEDFQDKNNNNNIQKNIQKSCYNGNLTQLQTKQESKLTINVCDEQKLSQPQNNQNICKKHDDLNDKQKSNIQESDKTNNKQSLQTENDENSKIKEDKKILYTEVQNQFQNQIQKLQAIQQSSSQKNQISKEQTQQKIENNNQSAQIVVNHQLIEQQQDINQTFKIDDINSFNEKNYENISKMFPINEIKMHQALRQCLFENYIDFLNYQQTQSLKAFQDYKNVGIQIDSGRGKTLAYIMGIIEDFLNQIKKNIV
ncbi:P-loop containing nucleoside triphosphate hydrolase [Pseudocohnilembus persalinus]|uniref:p-loop containing nucleoside triphosphate hydrolase n=1 Tax=Pseudocohnilembus persalinus TaxID=266149 RepID=A0A0V0QMZ0_PSEPJ|nr:P-loop containing nucleoside triphosphate hydrolase [Pseudocohnilembus persalinus]|eukprot:KRX03597.1 P-loop containing nucleoside triphosphate hydrolase [Pseudocohnilembus persalinus]